MLLDEVNMKDCIIEEGPDAVKGFRREMPLDRAELPERASLRTASAEPLGPEAGSEPWDLYAQGQPGELIWITLRQSIAP